MNSTIAKLSYRTIYCLLLLLAVSTILISIFLSQLELDNYRNELEQELSSALGQPVQIGYCSLTFANGIALRFQDMQIGSGETPLAVVPRLTATLKIAPLFKGRIILDQVEIDSPSFQIWLPIVKPPEQGTAHRVTDKFGIRTLTMKDASLKIYRRHATGSHQLLNLDRLNIELRGWQPNQSTTLIISGQLEQAQEPAKFLIDIDLPSSSDPAVWRNEPFVSQLSIDNLATGPLSTAAKTGFPTSINLIANFAGIPSRGVQIDIELTDNLGEQKLSNLTGRWTSSDSLETITALSGDLLGLPLKGEFSLQRQDQQRVFAGRFGAADITLDRELLDRWKLPKADNLLGGKLNRIALVVDKSWTATEPPLGLPRISAEVAISDLEWQENGHRQLQSFSVSLALEDKRLSLEAGELVISQQPVFFSGQIGSLFDKPQLDLKINLQGKLDTLFKQTELPEGWKLTGAFPITLALSGALPSPNFQLQADLTEARLALGNFLQKPPAQKSGLLLAGIVDSELVQLDRLELQLPGLSITGEGCFTHDPKSNFFLLDIDPIELAELQPLSPLLKRLRLQGNLHPTLERSAEGLNVSLQLSDVGVHLNNIVGDLNRTNGSINLDRKGLRFQNLAASLGKSAFILDGQIDNWQHPLLDLKLKSEKVRAQDLIFPNQELSFYNLNGRLLIDGGGIEFSPIAVRLEQDTEVIVTGGVNNFKAPQVTLDIAAEKANIDQVIALFVGPSRQIETIRKTEPKPVLITARVKQGTIGALRFQNAVGSIKDHHRIFSLYPLQFQSDAGFCLARVEFEHNRPGGLLKVSGHAENFDASVLHRRIFKKRGLVSGTLRGDFYLEGSPADGKFWHNAAGGIHVEVETGVLRKFSGLATVFSLLNVSQLFSGQLPDVNEEGMPFSLIEGSFKLSGGQIETEDLRVHSVAMNMALIGNQSLTEDHVNYNLAVMPLRTVDKVITSIPVAGWVLAGENKALLTAHFKIEGPGDNPDVAAVPISSVSKTVFGIIKRTLGLPVKLIKDVGSFFEAKPKKKEEPTD